MTSFCMQIDAANILFKHTFKEVFQYICLGETWVWLYYKYKDLVMNNTLLIS